MQEEKTDYTVACTVAKTMEFNYAYQKGAEVSSKVMRQVVHYLKRFTR